MKAECPAGKHPENTRQLTQFIHPNRTAAWLALLAGLLAGGWLQAAAPVVSNVRSAQRTGTRMVDIFYDLAAADGGSLTVSVAVSTNGGTSYLPGPGSFTGALGAGMAPGRNKQITWNAAADLPAQLFPSVRVSVTASDAPVPTGMALIPAGTFMMGNALDGTGDGYSNELPTHSVNVSAFYMDKTPVTKALWDSVYGWAIANGYSFDSGSGLGKAANHPVQYVT